MGAQAHYGHFSASGSTRTDREEGRNLLAMEHRMELLDERRAEYPPSTTWPPYGQPRWRGSTSRFDPTNTFNPGIGHTRAGATGKEANNASGGWAQGVSVENA